MRLRGSIPRVVVEADVVLALEAPADEPTLPGGLHGPVADYYEVAVLLGRPTLDEQLASWHDETWRAEA